MRNAIVKADGTILMDKIDRATADLARYLRFKHGETFLEIAQSEEMDPKKVEISVRAGRQMYEGQQLLELRDLKHRSLIEAERIREKLRIKVADQLIEGIETLLKGERTIVEVNKITGEVTMHKVVDPELIAIGIDKAMKGISLEERPAPNQTTVNIQQNNVNDQSSGSVEYTFEERLARIRQKQDRAFSPSRVIEASATDVTEEPATPVEAVLVDEAKPDEQWGF